MNKEYRQAADACKNALCQIGVQGKISIDRLLGCIEALQEDELDKPKLQKILDTLSEELKIQPGDTTDDGLFTLNATRCLGACGLAPVMMIGEDVFGRLTPEQVPGILDKFRA